MVKLLSPDHEIHRRSGRPPMEAVRELTQIRAMTYGFHRQGQSAEFPEKRKIALRPLDVSPYLPSLVSRTGSYPWVCSRFIRERPSGRPQLHILGSVAPGSRYANLNSPRRYLGVFLLVHKVDLSCSDIGMHRPGVDKAAPWSIWSSCRS